jgi:O-antigen/teichoic acid export membrane protein
MGAPTLRILLARGVSYQVLGQVVTVGASLAAVPLLSRYLGVEGYGVFATVLAFATIFSSAADLGLGATTVREVASGRVPDGRGVGSAMVVRALNGIWITAAGAVVAAVTGQPGVVVAGLAVGCLYVMALSLTAVGPNVVLQIRGRFGWGALGSAVQAVVWLAGLAVVVAAGLGVLGAIGALTLASFAALGITAWAAVRLLREPLSFDRHVGLSLLRQGLLLGVASLLAAGYYRVDIIVLSALAGSAPAGLYGAAYRFIDQSRAIAGFLGVTGHPELARTADDPLAFRSTVGQMALAAAVGGSLVAVVLFVFGEPLMRLLFGARFADAPGLLRVLSLAVLPMFLNNVLPYAMIARRRQAVYVAINFVALAVNLGGNVLLIPLFGPFACAWLTVVTECLVLCLSLMAMRRALGFVPTLKAASAMRPALWN